MVIGSDEQAKDRAQSLLECKARVTIVANRANRELTDLASTGAVELLNRPFVESDLDGKWLVVFTDRDVELAERIGALAEARRVLFCAVDQRGMNSFSHLALARAGALCVAIGTDGRAPSLARRLREELERLLTAARAAEFVERLASLRHRTPPEKRREVLAEAVEKVCFSGALELPELG
jgi:siroheme synthase-like protein